MTMDLPTLTPLAEFIDMLYTRCLRDSELDLIDWHIKLTPPLTNGAGIVELIARVSVGRAGRHAYRRHRCSMRAVDAGATVPPDVLGLVCDHHIKQWKAEING